MQIPHTSGAKPVAAVDLGSNSFHMIVAELRANEIVVVDRLREMVRMGSGLTADKALTTEIQDKALACLERFGQRLRQLPPGSVRVVGTNTLRAARNAQAFLIRAEKALGHPIEIISGVEEARLIYQGVSQSLAADGQRRLVMDIGGGSTEYIIGVDRVPLQKESLHMGCVSMTMAHFPDGKITAKRMKKAVIATQQELEPFHHLFHRSQWQQAVGASGTLRAIRKLLESRGLSREGITLEGLQQLETLLLEAGRMDKTTFPDVNPERYPSFPGGFAIIYATFKDLEIESMRVSDGALREGLLYDLLGRINHEDIRDRTVQALAKRYHIELGHAHRVQKTLDGLLKQVTLPKPLKKEVARQWLGWAVLLHEIGRDIAHSGYHKHGAYILENADLPGFSNQDQKLLAALVRCHRRKLPIKILKELAPPWQEYGTLLTLILRLSILLNRSREASDLPSVGIQVSLSHVELKFPKSYLIGHPLTGADLEQEAMYLEQVGITLGFA